MGQRRAEPPVQRIFGVAADWRTLEPEIAAVALHSVWPCFDVFRGKLAADGQFGKQFARKYASPARASAVLGSAVTARRGVGPLSRRPEREQALAGRRNQLAGAAVLEQGQQV